MTDIYFEDFYQDAPNACVDDVTPPVFSGIATLIALGNGALEATWSAAASANPTPTNYEVYILPSTSSATSVFSDLANIVTVKRGLSARIWTEANETTYLGIGKSYRVGVRSVDAVGNRDQNLVELTAVSHGVLPDCLNDIADQLTQAATSIDVSATVIASAATSLTDIVDSVNLTQRYQFDGEVSVIKLDGELTEANILC